ncbi:MAG: hypothetical protein GQ546_14920 [Gammaproteobacteria bacterium]|nr:hypothetical protein [Gammaproteobacteria bacterium]
MIQLYFMISVLIGVIVIADSLFLFKAKGIYENNKVLSITTGIEFIWAVISIIAIFNVSFSQWQLLIPSLYVIHNIFGWAYGVYLLSKSPEALEDLTQFVVPMWYVKFCVSYGIVFTLLCILAVLF